MPGQTVSWCRALTRVGSAVATTAGGTGRTVNACVVHAVGVNKDGFRESLGLDVVTSEDGAGWLAYVHGLVWWWKPW